MKMLSLLISVMIILIPLCSSFSQIIIDPLSPPPGVKEIKGDTLVIKTQDEMNGEVNALYYVITGDTINVPAGRVYELQAGGVYPLQNNPTAYAGRTTVIVGSDPTPLVNNYNVNSAPPLICGNVSGLTSNAGGISANGNLTIKNCALIPAANDSTEGWLFTSVNAANLSVTFDNCLFEHTKWIFVGVFAENCNVTFRNCYFVNMSGQPCRRNGGVFDCLDNQDTLLVENCTHIMAQGGVYKLRDYLFKRVIFNHNTFINCAGSVFMNYGCQNNMSLTNNIFVNCNVQSYSYDPSWDNPTDTLSMGLVNLTDTVPAPVKFLVDGNLIYWDPSLADCDSILIANKVGGRTNWQSQMITMNSRTQSMFNDNTSYLLLAEGIWYKKMPNFTNPGNLFTTQLSNLKTFALATVDTGAIGQSAILPDWRLINIGPNNYIYYDWPIPVNLSYTDADLLTGGTGHFPIGDLNWFPAQKTQWLAQRTAEYALIQYVLDHDGIDNVERENASPHEFRLQQNYPNPFNPGTTISIFIPKAGHVTLKVCNILGQEVATLIDGFKTPQTYNLKFDGTCLASGVYFYRLIAPGVNQVKKMLLVK
jgi:hypothetical protein